MYVQTKIFTDVKSSRANRFVKCIAVSTPCGIKFNWKCENFTDFIDINFIETIGGDLLDSLCLKAKLYPKHVIDTFDSSLVRNQLTSLRSAWQPSNFTHVLSFMDSRFCRPSYLGTDLDGSVTVLLFSGVEWCRVHLWVPTPAVNNAAVSCWPIQCVT